ncbi:MAG TPA: cellulase family glycosylhydrolase [Bryobacteraceae bacterium]|jgi:hypothetical protein|nr:cellulase family glycosylhydrolase [Bryobacteraceae bacterium]
MTFRFNVFCCLAGLALFSAPAPAQVSDARYAHLARGVNLTRWFQYGGYIPVTATDRDLLKNAGFTSVRIAVAPQYLLPKWATPETAAKNLKNLDAGIDLFLNAGMAVMLDFQADVEYLDYYFSDPSAPAELVETWRMLAARYANRNPDLLFFEIMNEPDKRFTQADWDAEQKKALAAIRESAPNHTVLLAPVDFSGLDALLQMTPYDDPNVIYVMHYYQPMIFTHQGADWTRSADIAALRNIPWPPDDEWDAAHIDWDMHLASEWAALWHVRVVVNEFGAYKPFSPPEARARWTRDVRLAIEKERLGWAMWDYAAGFDLTVVQNGVRGIDPNMSAALGLSSWSFVDPVPKLHPNRFAGLRTVEIGASAVSEGDAVSILALDVNADGSPDIVMTEAGGPVRFFLNTGDGTMRPGRFEGAAPVLKSGASIVAGHFDRSGRPGFFFPDADGKSRLVLPAGTDALRDSGEDFPNGVVNAAAGDVDGDGVDDLVVFDPAPQLLRNDGAGHFHLDPAAFPGNGYELACGVFAGSELVTNGFVFSNDGKGRFAQERILQAPADGGPCEALNDGNVLIAYRNDMLEFISNTSERFIRLPRSEYGVRSIAISGKTLVVSRAGNEPLIYTAQGNGAFNYTGVSLPSYPWLVAPADFNRDGYLDLVFGQGKGAPLIARPGRF